MTWSSWPSQQPILHCCVLACCIVPQALELRSVLTYKSRVLVAHTEAFSGVFTEDFLQALLG